jgi:hypothetical protein
MYQKAGAVMGAGGLAYTGFDSMWAVMAGFALIAMGAAVLRIVPRFRRRAAAPEV